jgi:hypothetical protein
MAPAVDVGEIARAQHHRERGVTPVTLVDQLVLGVVAPVRLDRHHLLEALQDLLDPARHGLDKAQVQRRDLPAFGAQAFDRLLDRALGAAPADHQQIAFLPAEDRRSLERLLQRRELQAAVPQAFLVDLRIVGDVGEAVVRRASPVSGSQS